jgi:ubiquinone/menaquinone biosynthesis C-methylase UbiE
MHEITSKTSHPRAVVDVGCGSGQFLRKAAAVFPEAELVGVDGSAAMIHAAVTTARDGERIRFVRGRAESLPLADGSFDLAVTTASFHHWADQSRGLAEVSRVLRAGGTFVLADVVAAGALRVGVLSWLLGRFDRGRYREPEVLDRMLASAGFQVERRTPAPQWGGALQVTVARRV